MGCEPVDDIGSMIREGPQFVVTCLPSEGAFGDVIRDLCIAAPLALERRIPVVVDTSTLSLETKQSGCDQLAATGVTLLDCPMSGTGAQALKRDIVVFASGPEDALAACQQMLDAIAREVRRVGAFGMGSRMKFLANLLVVVHTAAAAEMLALAELAGVDPVAALDAVCAGAGQSRMLEKRGQTMAAHTYEVTATVRIFRKDLEIIESFARTVGATTPMLSAAAEIYDQAGAVGLDEHDVTSIHELYMARRETG